MCDKFSDDSRSSLDFSIIRERGGCDLDYKGRYYFFIFFMIFKIYNKYIYEKI